MSTTVKTGWLNDKDGNKFAPKTLTSQVQTSDGVLLEDKIQADLDAAKEDILSNVTIEVDTELSSTSTNPVQNKALYEEFEAVATAMNVLESDIDDKADAEHTHDDRYYTEAEVDAKIDAIPSDVFVVNVTGNSTDGYTADKSYQEVVDLWNNNKYVYCFLNEEYTYLPERHYSAGTCFYFHYNEIKGSSVTRYRLALTSTGISRAVTTFSINSMLQNNTVSSLTTTDETIVGAINELNSGKANADHTHSNYASTVTTTGSGNAITAVSQSGNTITATKESTFLTAHPTISISNDTTSTSSPAHAGTFTAVDSVTRDDNGHVTKVNTKTVTLPAQYSHPTYTAITGVPTANQTPAFGGTFNVSQPVSDSTGHITAVNSRTITIPNTTATQSTAGLLSAEDKTQLDYGGIPIVTTDGDGAAYTATVDGVDALTNGMKLTIIPHTNSTTTAPTLNVNSLGAKYIRMPVTYNTSTSTVGAVAAWIVSGKPLTVQYNGMYWLTVDLPRPSAQYLSGAVPVANGGTGATTAADALTNFGITATADELNILDGVTATATELNYVDGVTSNIQTQLNGIIKPVYVGSIIKTISSTAAGELGFNFSELGLSSRPSVVLVTVQNTQGFAVYMYDDSSSYIRIIVYRRDSDSANTWSPMPAGYGVRLGLVVYA